MASPALISIRSPDRGCEAIIDGYRDSDASDYWRWSKSGWHNRIQIEIARVFERHGFIWGGRWYHYDTMHFEYRPELLP